ncbi:cathepsin L1-like [Rhagoletis pomonella]|uniref:cathepsin L1-like n=1 Tax=Rhagoletis pomonella TaxID=28610 RepID=UPI00177AF9B2|nr:cathepsin L1-like [Rhagoletis pomonella]
MKEFIIVTFFYLCWSVSFGLSNAAIDEDRQYFQQFKLVYNKHYETNTEERKRERLFLKNFAFIEEHNLNYTKGLTNYELGVNEYADLSDEEFTNIMIASDDSIDTQSVFEQGATFIPPANVELPDAVDWRELGAVTEVKKQDLCGAAWAFTTTGALEGQYFRKTSKLISLSEQNLIDCTIPYGNKGCRGGTKERSFLYVRDNGGINSAAVYPYRAQLGPECLFDVSAIVTKSKGFVKLMPNDENALKAAAATVGPIAVKVNAKCFRKKFYRQGIFDDEACKEHKSNHAMLLVGYGRDNVTNKDYWILKNSWGHSWGMDGYMKIPRHVNYGGIAMRASYPLMQIFRICNATYSKCVQQ